MHFRQPMKAVQHKPTSTGMMHHRPRSSGIPGTASLPALPSD